MSEPVTRFVVGKREGGKRLDQFLHERIPGVSRTRIQKAIRERVTLSWEAKPRPSTPVRPGEEVNVGYTPIEETPLDIELEILEVGKGWLAVNKPPGIVVHPVNKVRENSLIRLLRRQEGDDGLRLAHRLDRETSGVLLVASDAPTASVLSTAFMNGGVHKEYLALVRGVVEADRGQIALPIGDDDSSAIYVKRSARAGHEGPDAPDSQAALTEWQVESRLSDRTLLRLFPRTGRRHQLRVHLAAIGHAILGDILYGRPDGHYLNLVRGAGDERDKDGGPKRQLLHCARLEFADPTSGDAVTVDAPLPADFGEWMIADLELS